MLFTITNRKYQTPEQLRERTLVKAYLIIKNYPIGAQDVAMDNYIQQQYKQSMKELCIELLFKLTFHKTNEGSLILLFKDSKYDKLAQLITYGNGAIPGSKILQQALQDVGGY